MTVLVVLSGLTLGGAAEVPRAKAQTLREGWLAVADARHEMSITNFPNLSKVDADFSSRPHKKVSLPYGANVDFADYTSLWLCRDLTPQLEVKKGERVYLELADVNYRCRAWLDGQYLGQHDGSCGTFAFDVTSTLTTSTSNLNLPHRLVLNVETCPKGGTLDGLNYDQLPIRTPWAYLQQAPRLVVRGEQQIADLFVRTFPATGAAEVRVTMRNLSKTPAKMRLAAKIAAAGDAAALDAAETEITLPVGESEQLIKLRVPEVRLWSIDNPWLYRVTVRLGSEVKSARVGYRDMRVDDEGYFTLNGKRVFIKCCHTGPYFPDAQFSNMSSDNCRRHLLYLKACGLNTVRYILCTSYSEMIDLCDEIGLMVYEEHSYSWLKTKSMRADEFMLKTSSDVLLRDRNHASFTIFGMLNETETTAAKTALDEAADKCLPFLRSLVPDTLIMFQSGRWDGQLGRASASNPGSMKWDAWMGAEGPDKDMSTHTWSCNGVGDVHYYPEHPLEGERHRTFYERALSHRRAAFMSESGFASAVNMIAGQLKFDMLDWSRTANNYEIVKEHAQGFRKFFEEWHLNAIWPNPEAFVFASQEYQARQRQLISTYIRRAERASGYSITISADMAFHCGGGIMDGDASLKRDASETISEMFADLAFCLIAKDTCVFDTAGLDLDARISDFGLLKPNVKYPIRLRLTSSEGVKWEKKLDLSVKADAKGRTPTMTKIFAGHIDTTGWKTDDYVFTAEFLEGAYATCGERKVYVIAKQDVDSVLKGVKVEVVGTNTAERVKSAALVKAAGGEVSEPASTILVAPGWLADDEVSQLLAAAERGSRVVFADAASLTNQSGKLRLPFAKNAFIHKEWNWLYRWEAIVHQSALTEGLKNRMLLDTAYFGSVWSDRCVCDLPPADEIGVTCAYLGIDGNATKRYYNGLLFGAYRVGKGWVVISTLPLNATDPVAVRLWANSLRCSK